MKPRKKQGIPEREIIYGMKKVGTLYPRDGVPSLCRWKKDGIITRIVIWQEECILYQKDTIAALATAQGEGGIAIVRISGDKAEYCLQQLFVPCCAFESHRMYYGHLVQDGQTLDECMAVIMRAPRSYTREDVAEIHLHGGSFVAGSVLRALYALGVRPASAGEFTKRAFLNGRIDLSRAEAVMALISAEGGRAARAAVRQLSGVAAAIDYPEEITFEEAAGEMTEGALKLADELENACDERGARIARSGLEVVLCGCPNVGKSSLLNALSREEVAIVTDIPGTTRDILRSDMLLSGLKVRFVDTAGLRQNTDTIEAIGVEKAKKAVASADVAVVVLDASRPLQPQDEALLSDTKDMPRIIVLNKWDLPAVLNPVDFENAVCVSAARGQGMDRLEEKIVAFGAGAGESELTQERHMALAREAAAALRRAAQACRDGEAVDVAAVELNEALHVLGRITGDQVDEKLLDDVFSRFCVGK